jgi:glycosyltransferase involved in cell wall biosynthesis
MREYPGMDGYFFHDRQNALIFQEAAGMVHCVRMLCKDRALREQIGSASRASVEQEASFEIVLKKYREKLHY